jgi:salicylate hydroxylase/6-hydroxynicotinate 3-monooxygenase
VHSITIIGAGIGGLAAAAALRQRGIAVAIYEQADKFARVGAGIQQSPIACARSRFTPHLRSTAMPPPAT